MKGVIYKVRNTVNNKIYIGQTIDFKSRKASHLRAAFNPNSTHYNSHFMRAIRKYGEQMFDWVVIHTVEGENKKALKRELDKWEIYYIGLFNSYNNGYNMTLGGEGSLGREQPANKSKAVIRYSYIDGVLKKEEWPSIKEASLVTGLSYKSIYRDCTRENKFRGSYLWQYK